MARIALLEENNFILLKELLNILYPYKNSAPNVDFSNNNLIITPLDSGRLSFTFLLKSAHKSFFLKITKPGLVKNNFAFAVELGNMLYKKNHLFNFKIFKNFKQKLYFHINDEFVAINKNFNFLLGQKILLAETIKINTIAENIDLLKDKKSLMQKLGAFIVDFSYAAQAEFHKIKNLNFTTNDPAGFMELRNIISNIFLIPHSYTYLKNLKHKKTIKKIINKQIINLSATKISYNFKQSLEQGDLFFLLNKFNEIEQKIAQNLNNLTNVIINNEIKPSNIGAIYKNKAWYI